MRAPNPKRSVSLALAGVLLPLFLAPGAIGSAAPLSQRTAITAVIVLREGDNLTLNRGSEDGFRKGDKLLTSHSVNGKFIASGAAIITRVYGTTSEAHITEQSGAVGPEDNVTLDVSVPAPKTAPVPSERTRKTLRALKAAPVPTPPVEPPRKVLAPLPLLPQFSADKEGGACFAFDFTNEGDKEIDTGLFRTSAHLIFDAEDYRTIPITLSGDYNLAPGKTRAFSLHLSDFTVARDKDVWPLKSGRHTALIKFGGRQYGPLTFDWRADAPAQPSQGAAAPKAE